MGGPIRVWWGMNAWRCQSRLSGSARPHGIQLAPAQPGRVGRQGHRIAGAGPLTARVLQHRARVELGLGGVNGFGLRVERPLDYQRKLATRPFEVGYGLRHGASEHLFVDLGELAADADPPVAPVCQEIAQRGSEAMGSLEGHQRAPLRGQRLPEPLPFGCLAWQESQVNESLPSVVVQFEVDNLEVIG